MTFALYERFADAMKKEAERLLKSEEGGINPKGVKKDEDGFEYVYSLAGLDKVIGYFASFEDCLSKRGQEEKNRFLLDLDKETSNSLPGKIAFGLRGYIGAVSEDSILLEGYAEVLLQNLLDEWLKVKMKDGKAQVLLSEFLLDYEIKCIDGTYLVGHGLVNEELEKNKDQFIKRRVERKLRAFKEVMLVSSEIAEDMFLSVWGKYNENLSIQEKERVNQQKYFEPVFVVTPTMLPSGGGHVTIYWDVPGAKKIFFQGKPVQEADSIQEYVNKTTRFELVVIDTKGSKLLAGEVIIQPFQIPDYCPSCNAHLEPYKQELLGLNPCWCPFCGNYQIR